MNALKAFRQRHEMSQSQLRQALDITQSRLSNYEHGTRQVPVDIAYRFIDLAKTKGEVMTLEDVFPRAEVAA